MPDKDAICSLPVCLLPWSVLTTQSCCADAEQTSAEAAEPMAEDQPQASESAAHTHMAEVNDEQQPDESETQDNYQLDFSLVGDAAAETDFSAFCNESVQGAEGFSIALDADTTDMGESMAQQGALTEGDEVMEADSVVPEASTESAHLSEEDDSSHMEAESSPPITSDADSSALTHSAPETASGLTAEDSFTADTQNAQALEPKPAGSHSAFANSAFANDYKQSPFFNPMFDSVASPEQPSRSQNTFPGTASSPQAGFNGAATSAFQVRI